MLRCDGDNPFHLQGHRHKATYRRRQRRCASRVVVRNMGSAGALRWTPFFRFCRRGGRSFSAMASIEQYGLVGQWDVPSRETWIDPGGRVSLPDQ